jgi:hypothetical protein
MKSDTTRKTTTAKHARTLGSLLAAGALLAAPASGLAAKPATTGKAAAKANACKAVSMPYNVSGKFVSADVAAGTMTMTVTGANRHARNSGEIADQDAAKKGVQVKGATMVISATPDAFVLKLDGYEAPDTPSAGDRVHVRGKVALTKKRCAAAATSTADRHGAVDIRKVTVSDRDADA